jgi:acylphosphatase
MDAAAQARRLSRAGWIGADALCWFATRGFYLTALRRGVLVRGVVQGVGFRPFVYRLALEEGLAGFIGNDTDGVTIEIEGPEERWRRFLTGCAREAPPLARIDSVAVRELPLCGDSGEFPDCCQRGAGPGEHRDSGGRGDLPGLPAGVA